MPPGWQLAPGKRACIDWSDQFPGGWLIGTYRQVRRISSDMLERIGHVIVARPIIDTTMSLGFSHTSFTIFELRKRSYARPSSLPRPVKAQRHCVRKLNRELNNEENYRASKFHCRCVFVRLRRGCASRSSHRMSQGTLSAAVFAQKSKPPWNGSISHET